ncbi:hypothetical protein [Pseudoalteromonas sp. 68 DY56-GL68]|uniref:hypothetical protein n=1 Tax=Pseudoalteromonas sp. 68 DY56-GL68 TaxID=2974919 RepID=UPI00352A144E
MMLSAVGVVGCSKAVPRCGDSETTDLVKQIASREMGYQIGNKTAKLLSYEVSAIRTTSTNEQTGANECAAELAFAYKDKRPFKKISVIYTVEVTDDNEVNRPVFARDSIT